jgi:hypothetical protein
MGYVLAGFGALAAAVETTYGTKVTPTDALLVNDDADQAHDDSFNEVTTLRLSSSGDAPVRQHNKLDLSATVRIGPMQDIDSGRPSIHPLMVASGHAFDEAGVGGAGSGNYIEYTPRSSGFGSASLVYYMKDETTGNRSITDYLGYRCNATFSITPGEDFAVQVEGSSLHGFPAPFATPTAPATYGLSLGSYPNKCWSLTIDKGAGPEVARLVSFELNRNLEIVANTDDVTACGDGVAEIEATSGAPIATLVFELEADHLATSGDNNFVYDVHENPTDLEIVLVHDSGDGQTITITLPKARGQDQQIGSGDRRRQVTLALYLQPTTTDDEYSIRWEVV